MRLLADENFPKPTVGTLRAEGHDVLRARTDLSGWKDASCWSSPNPKGGFCLPWIRISARSPFSGACLLKSPASFYSGITGQLRRILIRSCRPSEVESGLARKYQHCRRQRNSDAACSQNLIATALPR